VGRSSDRVMLAIHYLTHKPHLNIFLNSSSFANTIQAAFQLLKYCNISPAPARDVKLLSISFQTALVSVFHTLQTDSTLNLLVSVSRRPFFDVFGHDLSRFVCKPILALKGEMSVIPRRPSWLHNLV